jgi:hypothetical protein
VSENSFHGSFLQTDDVRTDRPGFWVLLPRAGRIEQIYLAIRSTNPAMGFRGSSVGRSDTVRREIALAIPLRSWVL